jgi:hypothetical protein
MNQATEHLEPLTAKMKKISLTYPAWNSPRESAMLPDTNNNEGVPFALVQSEADAVNPMFFQNPQKAGKTPL